MKNIPHERDIAQPIQRRRDHPTPGIAPRMSIEAHASTGKTAAKNLQGAAPVHPSMTGNRNRGFAAHKAQAPAQPINASPSTSRPTPAPDVHNGATGRYISGADTPGDTGGINHHPVHGDRVLDEAADQGAMSHAVAGERHHSTVHAKGAAVPEFATDKLPAKPADSATSPQAMADQLTRWNKGEC